MQRNFDYDEDDFEPDYEDQEDDFDNGYSFSQQRAADLSDYANEQLRAGRIDAEQAAEIRAGA